MSRERDTIELEMVFNQSVWDTILSGADNHKGGIEREYFFIFCLFNQIMKNR